MKKTALNSIHRSLNAKMVEFGGWDMPVQYGPILDEVRKVRTQAGLFDLSHMGRVRFAGKDAIAFADRLLTNEVATMKDGQIRYSLLCHANGNCVDDVLVYKEAGGSVYLVINAGNTAKDLAWIREQAKKFSVEVQDLTDATGMIAMQGPLSQSLVSRITKVDLAAIRYYFFSAGEIAGIPHLMISRTGYTGEDGFEIYAPNEQLGRIWSALMEAGAKDGLAPIGLGARDTLRLEAGMPLYGHEIDDEKNPLEAGLGWAVKFSPGKDFLGRKPLEELQAKGFSRKLVGFKTESKRVPRQGYAIVDGGKEVGKICSGSPSPTLHTNIGTGYVPAKDAIEGSTRFSMRIHDTDHALTVVSLPFYKRKK